METNRVPNSAKKLDRKTIERNRRIQMKGLILQLTSIVPPEHFKPSKEMLSQKDQIDQVASYIKQLSEKVEQLKKRRKLAKNKSKINNSYITNSARRALTCPVVKVQDVGSSLEVVLKDGLKKKFALYQVIRVLEEEGLEVNSACISTVSNTTYYVLHAQVKLSRFGVDSSMIYERLQKLLH